MGRPKKPVPSKQPLPGGLSAEDVCAIIRSCRQNQVVTLKLGELQVSFGPEPVQFGSYSAAKAPELTEEMISKDDRQKQVDAAQARLDQLAIEDPAEYEKFVMSEDAERSESMEDDE